MGTSKRILCATLIVLWVFAGARSAAQDAFEPPPLTSTRPAKLLARGGTMKLRDICRLKGQEINVLQGLGLVVGLRGTGDSKAKPTARALARMIQLMGGQVALDRQGNLLSADVEKAGNVALVFVTARIPAVGAQAGDRLDCTVSAISAKSLEGGYLMLTPLLGPRSDQPQVYALAEGPLARQENNTPTVARIDSGAKMEAAVRAEFESEGRVTLVLDRDFADFDTAQRIEDNINNLPDLQLIESSPQIDPANASARLPRARAVDQLHIEVAIPEVYRDAPIKFLSYLLQMNVSLPQNDSRVVINEREGVVIVGEDVRIPPVAITHRGMRIEAAELNSVVGLDSADPELANNPKLRNLVDALNALDVPTADLIAIIKALKAKGDLYGEVVFQ